MHKPEREPVTDATVALEFLNRFSLRIGTALERQITGQEKYLTVLMESGPKRFGPDDLDMMVKGVRVAIEETREAARILSEMAPYKEVSAEDKDQFVEDMYRIFPDTRED